jgi:c-di-GMP-binding flagellar brake protein YcgR
MPQYRARVSESLEGEEERRRTIMEPAAQTSVGQFLTAVAEGFVQTRFETILFFLLVIAGLLVVFLYFAGQNRREHRELARRSREILEHLFGKPDLKERERALLGRLALHLDPGEPGQSLLLNYHVFDACARKMRQREDVSEDTLNALRLKMGFRITQPEEVPASSSELPEGSCLLLLSPAGQRVRARILAQAPAAMLASFEREGPPLVKGMPLTVYFHNRAGIFSFSSRITDLDDDALRLEHSSSVTHHQRRKYYRRKESLPVLVTAASPEALPRESLLLDLGGGGASLQNPGGHFKKGDLLELSFSPLSARLSLMARVMRVSKNGAAMGVRFVSLSEMERSRIMSFLFRQPEREEIPLL